jgi:hypothetical protein
MGTQNRVQRVYRRRSPAEIAQLLAEYERSGLSRSAFCREKGITGITLQAYELRQRRMERDTAREKGPAGERWGAQEGGETSLQKRWLAVEVKGAPSAEVGGGATGLAVLLPGGYRIEISRQFDGETLKRLLSVVERG